MFGGDTDRDRILLVDDEPGILVTTQAILEADGYEVETASSGQIALQMMEVTNYDLMIVDLRMEGVDGLELLEQTQHFFPQPLTIVLTGYASLESAIKALHLGAYDYLIKPCNVFDLKYSVKRALERRRLSEAEALLQVSHSINSSLDRDEILSAVAHAAVRVLKVERGIVALFEPTVTDDFQVKKALAPSMVSESLFEPVLTGGFQIKAISTVPREGELIEELIGRLYCEHPEVREHLLAGHPFASGNTAEDLRLKTAWAPANGVCAFLAAPIHSRERFFGMLYVDSTTRRQNFNSAAMRLIHGLADQAAVALENARLFDELVAKNHEFVELNERLKKLDRFKSNLLNIATHDLRTPISIVLGYNLMLKEELDSRLSADQRDLLEESITNCRRLIQLVNSMLDISRIESGRLEINIADNDIRWCIDSAVKLLRERLRAKQIELEVEVAPSLPPVPFDVDRVQQVLINLIDNAIKFTAPGGKITVRALLKKNDGRSDADLRNLSAPSVPSAPCAAPESEFAIFSDQVLEVSVEDTGVGICKQEQAIIFDEFVQSSNQPKEADGLPGSGLGLAIAKRIIAAHKGKIWVESRLHKGSKFIFQLPVVYGLAQEHNCRSRKAAQGIAS